VLLTFDNYIVLSGRHSYHSFQNQIAMSYNEKVHVRWNRSTIFCAFLVASTAFTCPGIFGALNGLGAGGGASPDVSNAANAIVFGCLAVGSLFVGGIANRITPKYALLVGTISLRFDPYMNNNQQSNHIDWNPWIHSIRSRSLL
jgi:hypothetical protein